MPVRTLNWTIHNFLVNRGNEINKCKEDITKLKEHIDKLNKAEITIPLWLEEELQVESHKLNKLVISYEDIGIPEDECQYGYRMDRWYSKLNYIYNEPTERQKYGYIPTKKSLYEDKELLKLSPVLKEFEKILKNANVNH